MTSRTRSIPLVLALFLATAPALAQQADKARSLFNVGAAAYEHNKYADAIQAFEGAYAIDPRPGILFSMAQAHRRQYAIDRQADHVHQAVKLYRDYLAKSPDGSHRTDAVDALQELDPIEQRLGAAAPTPAGPVAAPVAQKTRLMASSDVKEATIRVDGGPAKQLPFSEDIKPGKHAIKVSAPGYFDYDRDIDAPDSGIVPVDAAMRERPALLTVKGDAGAQVSVDGRPSGTTPLVSPIELSPGRHFVAITKNGYKAITDDVDVAHGETKTIDAKLARTGQRVVSYVFLASGVVGIAAGAVFSGIALHDQQLAQDFIDKKDKGPVLQSDLDDYNDAITQRENQKRFAGVAFGAGATLGAVGVALFFLDQPTVSLPNRRDDKPKPQAPAPRGPSDLAFAPIVGPSAVGGTLRGSF
jgi:hypothetical protein